jgi:antibiotic biosynthesis monooxygenase (ABM) superfamily enzyme
LTTYIARTYVVKTDKLKEHNKWGKKLITLMKKKPGLFNNVKSLQVLSHKQDEKMNRFTAVWGFESLANIEGWERDFNEIPQENALREEFMDLIVPKSYSACILESIKTIKRKRMPKKLKSNK